MTLQINMNPGAAASGGVGIGVMTSAGNPWSVPDALAQELVNRGVATPVITSLPPSYVLTAWQNAALAALTLAAACIPTGTALANSAALDSAVASMALVTNGGGVVSVDYPGAHQIAESLLLPSNVSLRLNAGVTLQAASANNRTMVRTSNVRVAYDGAAISMIGFQVLYADTSGTSGLGTLTYTNSGTTLTWQAPGDTAGTPVNIGTAGYYRIPSGTAGKALYIMAPAAAERPGSNCSQQIYVSALKGAQAMTVAVTSNLATVVEANHGRAVGDTIELYRDSSGAVTMGQIKAVTDANTYTVPWTVADFTSESGRVHGVRNISVHGPGVIDQQRSTQTNGVTIERFPFQFQNVSKVTLRGYTLKNAQGQGCRFRNSSDFMVDDIIGDNSQNLLQWEGPADRINIGKVTGHSGTGDDLVAFTQTYIGAAGSYTSYATHTVGTVNASIGAIHSISGNACALKLTGYTGSVFNVTVGSIKGTGLSAAVLAVVDTATLTGGALGKLVVNELDWTTTGGLNVGEIISFTMTGGAQQITFNNVTWNGTSILGARLAAASGTIVNFKFNGLVSNNSPTNAGVSVSQTVTNLTLQDCAPTLGAAGSLCLVNSASANITNLNVQGGNYGGSSTNTRAIYHITGTITNINFGGGLYCGALNALYRNEATASNAPIINLQQVVLAGTGLGLGLNYTGGTVVVNLGQVRATSIGNNLIQDAAGTSTIVNFMGTVSFTGFGALFLGSGTTRTVYGLDFTQSPTFSATPTFRLSNGNKVTPGVMTANITAITLQDIPPAGQTGSFVFTQDATGGRTLAGAFPATVKFPTGAYTDTGNTANKKTVINWVSDGTNLIVQGVNAWN